MTCQHVEDPKDDNITHLEHAATTQTTRKGDAAAEFLADAHVEDASFSYKEERAVLKRIDYRVLPLPLGAYFFQQLDRSSWSCVSIFGIQKDANLLVSVLCLAQLVMQPLAAYLLVKLPTDKVSSAAIFLWGSSLAFMSACTDSPSLLGLRYYQGIYMFCGLLTVAYSCVLLSWIPDGPMKPKYLNERERFIAVQRLRANQMGIQPEQSNGSVSTFGNLIIRDFGYTNFQSIFFKSSFGVIQIVCIVGSVWGAVLGSRKGLAIAMVAILPIVGTIIIMCIGNVIGPLLYSVDDAPLHGPGLIANIVIFALVAVIALLILRYLAFLNQQHAKKRMDMGKSAVRIDGSMLKKEKISQKGGEVEAQNQSHEQDNDFSDLTDMENEDFMCVY
ncbi:hypothetical protein COCC4DRAFT_151869 [Bipolaris maydis ATCC 48331]|uniref:Major facilitator superfamily (MFS) profile domain-containing protein n=2 Tax=Cochliobolus heterostrophus TaxID=5016 RepID=M2SJS1_COCH5|nr:uncharacterized protein COCC4DRAFT_151869 [Bipolaris maydis ATCC 48331]EMD85585.1 hypothetical protein COCHEDRAFT_1161368 [Bipolaris maydis C5]ENH99963.1 hypothetical protein COCC4DRAFT_151869 [Bipolaris maydis ATCC 48331]